MSLTFIVADHTHSPEPHICFVIVDMRAVERVAIGYRSGHHLSWRIGMLSPKIKKHRPDVDLVLCGFGEVEYDNIMVITISHIVVERHVAA